MKLINDRAVRAKLGDASRSTLWRLRDVDERFPRPVRLGGRNLTDEAALDAYLAVVLAEGDLSEPSPREGEARQLGADPGVPAP